ACGQITEFVFHGDGVGGDVDAVHGGGAGVGAQETGDQLHRRGLAGAIGAEEAEDVAAFDGEGHAVNGANGAEGFNQAFDFDHGWEKREGRKRQETVSVASEILQESESSVLKKNELGSASRKTTDYL